MRTTVLSPLLWLAAAGFLLVLPQLEGITKPLLTGLCIALYLEPSCSLAERLLKPLPFSPHRRRQLAVALACLLWGGGALVVCWLAGPALSQSLRQAADMLPSLMQQTEQLCQRVTGRTASLPQLPGDLLAGALPSLTAMTSQLAGIGGTLLVGIILGGWMLLKKAAIFSLITQLISLSPRMEEDLLENLQLTRRCFSSFVSGQLTEALILNYRHHSSGTGSRCIGGRRTGRIASDRTKRSRWTLVSHFYCAASVSGKQSDLSPGHGPLSGTAGSIGTHCRSGRRNAVGHSRYAAGSSHCFGTLAATAASCQTEQQTEQSLLTLFQIIKKRWPLQPALFHISSASSGSSQAQTT